MFFQWCWWLREWWKLDLARRAVERNILHQMTRSHFDSCKTVWTILIKCVLVQIGLIFVNNSKLTESRCSHIFKIHIVHLKWFTYKLSYVLLNNFALPIQSMNTSHLFCHSYCFPWKQLCFFILRENTMNGKIFVFLVFDYLDESNTDTYVSFQFSCFW